jgi:hypothetical protein
MPVEWSRPAGWSFHRVRECQEDLPDGDFDIDALAGVSFGIDEGQFVIIAAPPVPASPPS